VTKRFAASKSITNKFTFEFSKTMSIFASITVSASVKLFGLFDFKRSNTLGFGSSVTQHQRWETSTADTYSINQDVTIPPFRRVTVEGALEMAENDEKPYVAQMLVKMNIIRLTKYSGAVVRESLPNWKIREHLQKHVEGKFLRYTADGVLIETRGTVRGSFGISTKLNLKEFPV